MFDFHLSLLLAMREVQVIVPSSYSFWNLTFVVYERINSESVKAQIR